MAAELDASCGVYTCSSKRQTLTRGCARGDKSDDVDGLFEKPRNLLRTMIIKNVVAAVLSVAVLVAAESGNATSKCTPVISGPLQMWRYDGTEGPVAAGANATKSGEHVSDWNVKHPLDVVYEKCTLIHGAINTPYTRVSLKDSDWCLTHNGGRMNGTGQLVLERCAKDADEVRQTQAFGLFYGKGMKGQNATLSAYMYGKNMSTALPFVGNLLRNEQPAM